MCSSLVKRMRKNGCWCTNESKCVILIKLAFDAANQTGCHNIKICSNEWEVRPSEWASKRGRQREWERFNSNIQYKIWDVISAFPLISKIIGIVRSNNEYLISEFMENSIDSRINIILMIFYVFSALFSFDERWRNIIGIYIWQWICVSWADHEQWAFGSIVWLQYSTFYEFMMGV